MPWNQESPMDQRVKLVSDWLGGSYTKSQLSRRYGVSRPTIDKWLERYAALGVDGLKEQSRKPLNCPHQTPDEIIATLLTKKNEHPDRGPKQIIDRLRVSDPDIHWPAASTAGIWLKKAGLVTARRPYPVRPRAPTHLRPVDQPNQTWCADYKGQFKMQDGNWCYPLTITDQMSRYLLLCRALPSTHGEPTRQGFEWAFREFGLPDVIRTDNGAPFASTGLARLSKLSVWFIRHGIHVETITPGRPDQNGRHERMHRTLKAAVLRTPAENLVRQQLAFEDFIQDFNQVRPHTALDMKPPASVYSPSLRPYPGYLPAVEYGTDVEVRKVRSNGEFKWKGQLIFLGEALIGEEIALKEVADDVWELYFCTFCLGRLERGAKRVASLEKV
ncbi:transposase [Pseudomonas sp. TH43]|uniref:integrase core domain-containing protein n=1 Tax=Pseudomonas sp. TH43 TaxID=2796407 RepID=UPI001911DE61|nr:integrase core domain-containing protein [Pseudomonas sp. TH43]MBK5376334.1 transposase [Pseudomonas sp. TH43]MBK5378094.1 transposase [Pseudomonas sp. TH43]